MPAASAIHETNLALARALGIPVENLCGFNLQCRPGKFPVVTAEFLVRGAAGLETVIRDYKLKPVMMFVHDE